MKILLINLSTFGTVGGIARYNSHLCKAISENPEYIVDVVSLCDSDSDCNKRYLSINTTISTFKGFNYRRIKFFPHVLTQLLAQSYDVCIIGHINLIPLILPIRPISLKTKFVLVVYGIDVWKKFSWLQRVGIAFCDQVWSISQFTSDKMQKANGKLGNIFILNNALDPYWEDQAKKLRDKSVPDSDKTSSLSLLTVSRLTKFERDKGHASVIKALPYILEVFPDVIYDIVGKGDLIPVLKRLAQETGVEDHVIFHGFVSDEKLHNYYLNCDIFAMPSKKEGFGYVYLEAMYYGKPVITGICDAGQEVIKNQDVGLSLDPNNVIKLSKALVGLLSNKKRRLQMGENGKNLVHTQYSYNRFKSTLDKYLSLIIENQA